MSRWCSYPARGAVLRDSEGREYIDGNSSIWTNLHGASASEDRCRPSRPTRPSRHTSFLGFTHPLAAELARELVALWPANTLTRVFFSDDGSTAMEVALKMAVQFWQQTGHPERTRFVAFTGAYHGDTMGASSLGGIATFHGRFLGVAIPGGTRGDARGTRRSRSDNDRGSRHRAAHSRCGGGCACGLPVCWRSCAAGAMHTASCSFSTR
ncbi:MAG: aminotransferase class III-fold pyridoxal phosphate-dependent enzyme [Chthoniobacter sp.]